MNRFSASRSSGLLGLALLLGFAAGAPGCAKSSGLKNATQSAKVTPTTPPDAVAPEITAFTIPATAGSLAITGINLVASDNFGVTGFFLSDQAVPPVALSSGWTATAPTGFSFLSTGSKTLYAWAKDAAGNISTVRSASVTISIADTQPPTISSFTLPNSSSSLTVTGIAATAGDNVGVTGYYIANAAAAPLVGGSGWSATLPTSFTFATMGSQTLWLWAKDAAGNVSSSRTASVVITLPDTVAPAISSFSLPATASSFTVSGITAAASDNIGVTGYYLSLKSDTPSASGSGWSGSMPTSFNFPLGGSQTLWLWVKDGAGNLSAPRSASVNIQIPTYDLVPLWENLSITNNDTLYTIDNGESLYATSNLGYLKHSAVAWLPCSKGVVGPSGQAPAGISPGFGYGGIPMNFGCTQPANAKPLYRFYNGPPAYDHFYTTSSTEVDYVLSHGWQFEKVEGYLFTTQVAGTVPLYRLSRCITTPEGCDVEHRFTLSLDTKDTLVAATDSGWAYDGIAGYAFENYVNTAVTANFNGTYNGFSSTWSTPLLMSIQNVVPTKVNVPISGSSSGSRGDGSGMLASTHTLKPGGATQQRINFSINTGNLFDANSNIDHIPVVLLGHFQMGSDGIIGQPYDGIGIFLTRPNWNNDYCSSGQTSGGQIMVEGFQNASFVECAHMPSALRSNTWYNVVVTATDSGTLSYQITEQATGTYVGNYSKNFSSRYSCPITHEAGSLALDKVYCNNPWSFDRYPVNRTGYAIVPIFGAIQSGQVNAQGTLGPVTVQWLDSSGNVLSSL